MTFHLRVAAATALMLIAVLPAAHAQDQDQAGARLHAEGLAQEKRGNEQGAFIAFLEAAESGHPPSQRRLGEIYDNGNSAVERDYVKSIIWYQRARDNGEPIPAQKPRMPMLPTGP